MLFPSLTAEWLHLVLYSTSLQNIIILDRTLQFCFGNVYLMLEVRLGKNLF
jgi:hypothetical protein